MISTHPLTNLDLVGDQPQTTNAKTIVPNAGNQREFKNFSRVW